MNPKKVARGLYAIWYREYKVFIRERSRVFSSIALPILFMVIFGSGIGSIVSLPGTDYQSYIFPGFLVMTVLFSSIFFGAYVVWDKKLDFLKGVLVSPQSRTTIFVGKAFGGVTDSLIEVSVLMLVGIAMGIPLTALSVGISYLILLFFIIGTVSLGLVIGSQMESPQGFGLISSFVVFPMFLLSGALYPLSNLPGWLVVLTRINPATYAVDGLRSIILGSSLFLLIVDLSAIILFSILMITLGTYAFNRMRV